MTLRISTERLQRVPEYFRRAVDAGRLPGYAVHIELDGATLLRDHHGRRDLRSDLPVEEDTRYRIFSMTKPMTSVAAMMLYERGDLELRAPVRDFIPEFADTPVCVGRSADPAQVEPQSPELTVWHLLTHTSGLTYPFMGGDNPVNRRYGALRLMDPAGPVDLAGSCRALATVPLLFQPGSAWNYSVSTDVLGRVLEVAAGSALDTVLARELLEPLGMSSTGFSLPAADRGRLATLYSAGADSSSFTPLDAPSGEPPTLLSGGAGLYSTLDDYRRFVSMLAAGGRVGDHHLVGRETLAYMARNHLPGGLDLAAHQRYPMEDDLAGLGFGLGFATVVDATRRRILTREGVHYWNGAGGSTFLVDPSTGLSATFMMQVRSPTNFRWESSLQRLIYQALL